MTTLARLVADKKLIVCVGAGGVGKTTTAASLALRAALSGRRALVLTIDPAKRLANALGLDRIGSVATGIDLGGRAAPGGALDAMMLDPRATLDDVVRRVSPSAQVRDALFANRIYRHIAGSFSGSQEYMASEQLYDVALSGRYDLVVLDTPPVKNALDFLDSPGRLTRFLDGQVIKWFLAHEEQGMGRRLLASTSAVVYGLLGHVFGREFLDELAAFFRLFGELVDGFRVRHEAVARMFGAPTTAFVVVSAPTESAAEVAGYFFEELRARRIPAAALVVNQVHALPIEPVDVVATIGDAVVSEVRSHTGEGSASDAKERLTREVLRHLAEAHAQLRDVARDERARVQALRARAGVSVPAVVVPRVRGEVHDLDGLVGLHRALFDDPGAWL